MNNLISVDFIQRKKRPEDDRQAIRPRLNTEALQCNIKALMLSIMAECSSVVCALESFERGNEGVLGFVDFFEESISGSLQQIEDAQHKVGKIAYKVNLHTEDVERANLGAVYGFLYE